jgi:hypothetical protein
MKRGYQLSPKGGREMAKEETGKEPAPKERAEEPAVRAKPTTVPQGTNMDDVPAVYQGIFKKMEAFESIVGNLQQKIATVETHTGNVQQEVLKGLNNIKGSVSEQLQSITTKLAEQIGALEKTFQKQQTDLDDKLKSSFENQQSTIDDRLKRSFAIERAMEEERLRSTEKRYHALGGTHGKTQRKMPWYFGFLENPTQATQGKKITKNGPPPITFDTVERQILSKICTGKKATNSVNRLIDSLKLTEDRRYEEVQRILKIILDRLTMEESPELTDTTRNFVLNELDRAEIAYLALKRHYKPVSKVQVRKILDRLLRRLATSPYATTFKDKVEFFRETLQDSNFALDDYLFKEIRNVEKELLAMGDLRLDSVSIAKYETTIMNWKKQIEKLLPETTLMILEPMLNWLQDVIQILSTDPNADIENEAFHLFFLLKQKEKEIKKFPLSDEIFTQIKALKKELDVKIYERVSLKDAQRYISLLLNWKKVILQIMSEEKVA